MPAYYPIATITDRPFPLPEPEKTATDWMGECAHHAACERIYLSCIDARELVGWEDDMATLFHCNDCECFD